MKAAAVALVTLGLAAPRADAALTPGIPDVPRAMVIVEQCDLRPLPTGGYIGTCRFRYCRLGRDGWPRACWRTLPWTIGTRE